MRPTFINVGERASVSKADRLVATADIGQEVAPPLLVGGWSGKKIVEPGSRIGPDDLARAVSEALVRT